MIYTLNAYRTNPLIKNKIQHLLHYSFNTNKK
uniref:Uncharacterized protein n=1 Tax=Lepeophtheirus salmonis TaxID=72036 RepID=A0A0K2VKY8_LEPSM